MTHPTLQLQNFTYNELFHSEGLHRLDQAYLVKLQTEAPELYAKLILYRTENHSLTQLEISELLISCAKILEDFLASFFGIEEEAAITQAKTTADNPISVFKKYFVLRRAKKEQHRASQYPS